MVQKFRRPQLSQTKDNAIDLSPAPLTAPKFGQKSGWPTPSVNRKARKKGIPPRRLLQGYRHPIFSVSPFFQRPPRDNFRRPCCDMQGRRTQRDSPQQTRDTHRLSRERTRRLGLTARCQRRVREPPAVSTKTEQRCG